MRIMQLTVIRIRGNDGRRLNRKPCSPMYVCICNALRDRELKAAAADPSIKSAACVFKRCDAKPKCGRCLPDVADMIAATRIGTDDLPAAAE
jgi:bacterioferritin-associated ferredoxin